MRSGSASNVRISAESQINTELARLLDDCMSEGNANTQGLETLAKTGYMEKILDAMPFWAKFVNIRDAQGRAWPCSDGLRGRRLDAWR